MKAVTKMNIFISGINGFIGRNLATYLMKVGHEVTGIDLSSNCLLNEVPEYHIGSVLDDKLLNKVTNNVDVVIHLAALTAHSDIVNDKFRALDINLRGTQNILKAFNNSERAHKFIYSSTGKVYGKVEQVPLSERSPTRPLNILGKSKFITEQLIDFYSNDEKDFKIFRMFQVYGPRQQDNFLIPTILSQINSVSGKRRQITLGDIKAKRDYVYVDDVVNAFVKAIDLREKTELNTLNICSGRPSNAEDIVEIISAILDIEVDIKVDRQLLRADEVDVEYGSYDKAQKFLGWSPQFTLEQGLESTIKNSLEFHL